ncbi:MAG: hypothetical protein RI935_378 [Candidatus Parcubacteria bacterium]|jgi:predicted RNase H-like HicB family nuclease
MSLRFTASIVKEKNIFVARCIELGVVSQGKALDEAMDNLQEAVSLYLENSPIKKSSFKSPVFISSFEVVE